MEETSLDNDLINSDFAEDFRSLGNDLARTHAAERLASDDQHPGYEGLDDNAIVDLVLSSNQEQITQLGSDATMPCSNTHKDA